MSLRNLPTELLLLIATDLDAASFLHLSMLSRRLQMIFLPLFFKESGTSLESREFKLCGSDMTLLSGLQISLHTTSIDSLSCTFNSGAAFIFREMHSLHCLVSRLASIGHVKLNLVGVNFHDCLYDARGEVLGDWALKLTALLNAIMQREETVLTVIYGSRSISSKRHFRNVVPSRMSPERTKEPVREVGRSLVQSVVTKAIRSFSSLKSRSRSREPAVVVVVPSPPTEPVLPIVQNPKIRETRLLSSILFHVPFRNWTIETLNATQITSLSLDNLALSIDDMGDCMTALTLPRLTKLALGSSDILFHDLVSFLRRHSTLQFLDLYQNTAHNPVILDDSDAPFLPNLKRITATPEYLTAFLGAPLSNLQKVTLTSDFHGMPPYGYCYSQFDPVYAALKERDVTLELVFLSGIGLELWVRRVSGHLTGDQKAVGNIGPSTNRSLEPVTASLIKSLSHVRALELGTGNRFYFSQTMMEALVGFLAMWPALENVVFKPPCVLQDGEEFSRELVKACRRLKRVEVNGAVYEE
ncbi:hypothetical protein C8J56DRAFT_82930 [Mycena floridula]|nr:hypothetical protein C8J56DRAFT_82930 [Mycena floridula]